VIRFQGRLVEGERLDDGQHSFQFGPCPLKIAKVSKHDTELGPGGGDLWVVTLQRGLEDSDGSFQFGTRARCESACTQLRNEPVAQFELDLKRLVNETVRLVPGRAMTQASGRTTLL
jgi:hypothetical protein